MTHAKPAPRGRDIHEQHRASTPLELLFDLVFVVAIAQAASQLHHGIVEHHVQQAILGYLLAFAAIWWAWMNYSWFASAYDDDSTTFRLLTLLQMGGVLVLAAGIPGLFSGDFHASVAGYVIMRLALCAQWLLAARGDPARRHHALARARGFVGSGADLSGLHRHQVTQGLALSWGLLLLSLGPVLLIAYNERGRRRYVDCFSVR